MSVKHPIIAITGSSGAGTTSVKTHVRADIPSREDRRRLHRGRRFPPLEPRGDARQDEGGGVARRQSLFSHFGPDANLFEELDKTFSDYAQGGTGLTRTYIHDAAEGRAARRRARHVHGLARVRAGLRPVVLRGPAWLRRGGNGRRLQTCRSQDRRRAGHQPRMDSEAAPRQGLARLFHRGGDRHDPAADARLHQLYLPAIHQDRHQLPARADGRHLQSVHRALDSDARRIHRRHPLPRSRTASTFPICCR